MMMNKLVLKITTKYIFFFLSGFLYESENDRRGCRNRERVSLRFVSLLLLQLWTDISVQVLSSEQF